MIKSIQKWAGILTLVYLASQKIAFHAHFYNRDSNLVSEYNIVMKRMIYKSILPRRSAFLPTNKAMEGSRVSLLRYMKYVRHFVVIILLKSGF